MLAFVLFGFGFNSNTTIVNWTDGAVSNLDNNFIGTDKRGIVAVHILYLVSNYNFLGPTIIELQIVETQSIDTNHILKRIEEMSTLELHQPF